VSRRPVASFPLIGLMLLLGHWVGARPSEARKIALLHVLNDAGDLRAAEVIDEALRQELIGHGELVDRDAVRDARRRLRIRDTDQVAPQVLEDLAGELSADWLLSVSVHDSERRNVPRLTLSARAYRANGELFWVGFEGGSGLDRRTVLGLRIVDDVETLAPHVVRRLLATLDEGGPDGSATGLGTLAIVPFESITATRGTTNSRTMTEAARAAVFVDGVEVVSSNCAYSALRRLRSTRRGAVDVEMRRALTTTCGADVILTGTVEIYEVGGADLEPEPEVTIAMRLLDADSGRILWTGAQERAGWDRAWLFRQGRIYSRGALTEQMMKKLTGDLQRHGSPRAGPNEEL
jgi:hypothetical protein